MAALQYMQPPIDKISALIDNMPMGPQKLQYLQHAANGAVQEVPAWLATSKLAALNTAEQQAKSGQMGGEQPTIKDSVVQAAGLAGVQNERMQAMQQQMAQQGAQQPGPSSEHTPQPQRQPQPEGGVAGLPVGSNMFSQKSFAKGGIAHFDEGGTAKDKELARIRAAIAELSGQPELPLNVGTPYSDAMARAQDMGQDSPDNVGIKKALAAAGAPLAAAADLAVLPINLARKYVHAPGTDTSDVSLAPVMDAQRKFIGQASDSVERGRPTNIDAYAPLLQQGSPSAPAPSNGVAANPTDVRLAANTQQPPQPRPAVQQLARRAQQVAPGGLADVVSPELAFMRSSQKEAVAPVSDDATLYKRNAALQEMSGLPAALAQQKAAEIEKARIAKEQGLGTDANLAARQQQLKDTGFFDMLRRFGGTSSAGQAANQVGGELDRQRDLGNTLAQSRIDNTAAYQTAVANAQRAQADLDAAKASGDVERVIKAREAEQKSKDELRKVVTQGSAGLEERRISGEYQLKAAQVQAAAQDRANKIDTQALSSELNNARAREVALYKDLTDMRNKSTASMPDKQASIKATEDAYNTAKIWSDTLQEEFKKRQGIATLSKTGAPSPSTTRVQFDAKGNPIK